MKPTLVVAGPRPLVSRRVASALRDRALGPVRCCGTREELEIACGASPDVVVIDPALYEDDLVEGLRGLVGLDIPPRVLALIGPGDVDRAQMAFHAGATGVATTGSGDDALQLAFDRVAAGETHAPPPLLGELLRRVHAGTWPAWLALTPRERTVVQYAARGASVSETSRALSISALDARAHLRDSYAKLEVDSPGAARARLHQMRVL